MARRGQQCQVPPKKKTLSFAAVAVLPRKKPAVTFLRRRRRHTHSIFFFRTSPKEAQPTFIYFRTPCSDAAASGSHTYKCTPGAGKGRRGDTNKKYAQTHTHSRGMVPHAHFRNVIFLLLLREYSQDRRRCVHTTGSVAEPPTAALMLLLLLLETMSPRGRRFLLRQNQTKTKQLSNLTRGGAPGQCSGTTFRLQAANRRRNHGGFVDEKRRWHDGGDDDGFKHGIFSILKVRNHGYGRSRGQSETRAR